MQHPPELKTKFLELRARGVSYSHIAEAINVSKPTLIQWGKDMAEEIADLQAAEHELVREKLLGNFEQWLARQVHHFNRLDEEFARREFKYSPTESVFRMMMASRKLLDRYFFEDDRRPRRVSKSDQASEGRCPLLSPDPSGSSPGAAAAQAPLPRAAETKSLGHSNHPKLGTGEGQTSSSLKPPTDSSSQSEVVNSGSEIPEISAPSRLCVEPPARPENPSTIQPLPNLNEGDSISASPNHNHDLNPTASSRPCVEGDEPCVETQNPAKTLPFPCQNSGVDNPNLSSDPLEGGAPRGQDQSEIRNPKSEIELDGESIPFSPFESTRDWLERQGIQASKIPNGARLSTAG